jgi:cobalt-zinc-cadmium efflux system outer membrane protein
MTLDQVLQYALQNHPLLVSRQHEVAAAQARLVTAGLLPNPELVLNTDTPVYATGDRTELSWRVVFEIPTAGKRWKRECEAQAGIRRSQMALERQSELILREAADAAIEVVYLQQLVKLRAELQQLANQRAAAAPSALGANAAQRDMVNRMRAEIDAVGAQSQVLDTQSALAAARSRLARAIGLAPDVKVTMNGVLDVEPTPLLPLTSVLAMARTNNPRLAEAWAAVSESQQSHQVALAEAVPDIRLGPRYRDELGKDDDGIGARIEGELPIFNRNQGAIMETASEIQANQALARVAELESLSDVAAAYAELETIQKSIAYYTTDATSAIERNQALINDPNVQAIMTPDQVAQIRLDMASLQLRLLQQQYRYHQLMTQMEILVGQQITAAQ